MQKREPSDWRELEDSALGLINDGTGHPPDPSILYHYSSPEAARLIIESGHVWASNVRYMNDLSELRYAIEVITKALTDHVSDVPERVMEMVRGTGRSLKKIIDIHDFYVTSFSGHPDLLGQWRAYCASGRGFALGFQREAISGLSGEFNLVRVEYSRATQELAVRRIFDLYRPVLLRAVAAGDAAFGKAVPHFGITLVRMLLAFKHEAFADEREYRLVRSRMTPVSTDQIYFRATDRMIVPFMKIDLASHDRNISGTAPLRRVVIGPCLDVELAEKSLRMLFRKFDYNDVDLARSEVPLAT